MNEKPSVWRWINRSAILVFIYWFKLEVQRGNVMGQWVTASLIVMNAAFHWRQSTEKKP